MIRLLAVHLQQAVVGATVGTAAVGVLAVTSSHHRRTMIELGQRYALAGRAALVGP